MSNPAITVLMPVYNGGEYLRLSIESILSQTYEDFELLIINDSSTDDSLDIIRLFKDTRIRIHSNSVNLGQTKSLNVGLRLARGKYIAINDADDFSMPRRLEKQMDFLSKNPDVIAVGTSAYIMDQLGKIKRPFLRPSNTHEILLGILNITPVIHGSIIIRKDIIMSHDGYDEKYRICQDFALWSSLLLKGYRIANIPDKLVVIRHYLDSISFKEKDTQTIENGKIIYKNVLAMTTVKITLEEAIRQRIFFTAPDRLTKSDFKKAEELFINEYDNIKDQYLFTPNFISYMLKKHMFKPFSKLSIAEFKKGNLKEARIIANTYIKNYSLSLIPLMIYIASFFNNSIFTTMIAFREKCQKLLVWRTANKM